jgi:hypothetical protein
MADQVEAVVGRDVIAAQDEDTTVELDCQAMLVVV